ncbi:MAG TPA: hypothetical protein VIU46_08415 [Gallionellaceae bacterium]
MESFKVFYTDQPLPAGQEPDYTFMLPLLFGSEEEALKEAFKLIHHGAVVWRIESPNGYYLDREAVEHRYKAFISK